MVGLEYLAERFVEHRRELRYSQSDIAKRAGVSRATIDAFENNRCKEIGFTRVLKIITSLGFTLELKTYAPRSQIVPRPVNVRLGAIVKRPPP